MATPCRPHGDRRGALTGYSTEMVSLKTLQLQLLTSNGKCANKRVLQEVSFAWFHVSQGNVSTNTRSCLLHNQKKALHVTLSDGRVNSVFIPSHCRINTEGAGYNNVQRPSSTWPIFRIDIPPAPTLSRISTEPMGLQGLET